MKLTAWQSIIVELYPGHCIARNLCPIKRSALDRFGVVPSLRAQQYDYVVVHIYFLIAPIWTQLAFCMSQGVVVAALVYHHSAFVKYFLFYFVLWHRAEIVWSVLVFCAVTSCGVEKQVNCTSKIIQVCLSSNVLFCIEPLWNSSNYSAIIFIYTCSLHHTYY